MEWLLKRFLNLFSEKREGREEEKETSMWEGQTHQLVASLKPPTRDLAHSPGMCPDREGIEPVTFWFTGQCSVHITTPTRAKNGMALKGSVLLDDINWLQTTEVASFHVNFLMEILKVLKMAVFFSNIVATKILVLLKWTAMSRNCKEKKK